MKLKRQHGYMPIKKQGLQFRKWSCLPKFGSLQIVLERKMLQNFYTTLPSFSISNRHQRNYCNTSHWNEWNCHRCIICKIKKREKKWILLLLLRWRKQRIKKKRDRNEFISWFRFEKLHLMKSNVLVLRPGGRRCSNGKYRKRKQDEIGTKEKRKKANPENRTQSIETIQRTEGTFQWNFCNTYVRIHTSGATMDKDKMEQRSRIFNIFHKMSSS